MRATPDIFAAIARRDTPLARYLDSLGLLNRRLIAAHCIFVNEADLAPLTARDAGIAHNMVANIKSAKGDAPQAPKDASPR